MMSLTIALANSYGIVISADRRLTSTITDDKTNKSESFLLTDFEQKIFCTPATHGLTYVGDAYLSNGQRTSSTIQHVLHQMDSSLSLEEELNIVKASLLRSGNRPDVTLLGAAISDRKNVVLTTSTKSNKITNYCNELGRCLAFTGETEAISKIVDIYPVEYQAFPLQESINSLRFLTKSVAGVMKYAQLNQTVSEECDILVISPFKTQWVTSPEDLY